MSPSWRLHPVELYGYRGYAWHGWQYIKHYAGHDDQKGLRAVMSVLAEVEKCWTRFLGRQRKQEQKRCEGGPGFSGLPREEGSFLMGEIAGKSTCRWGIIAAGGIVYV